jgi:hypothetical protein
MQLQGRAWTTTRKRRGPRTERREAVKGQVHRGQKEEWKGGRLRKTRKESTFLELNLTSSGQFQSFSPFFFPLQPQQRGLSMASSGSIALINRLYTAFKNSDGEAMAACYHPEATFSDPVFPALRGREVGDMWRFLCAKKADPESRTFSGVLVSDDGATGSAHWEARYKFPLNGNAVHNVIDARFRFLDGLIVEHRDTFDFYWWARQAFGLQGLALGWTSFFQTRVQESIRARMDAFVKSRGSSSEAGADGSAAASQAGSPGVDKSGSAPQ